MPKIKGLGRGLDALLANQDDMAASDQLRTIPVTQIKPGRYQPRTRMDAGALQELADSIKTQGLMQPVLVRLDPSATRDKQVPYEIIAGERRWRAAQLAGLKEIPALVREVPDQAAAAMSLIENIQREDLNALEEAQGFKRLIEEFSLTHEQVANAVGRSRSSVSNMLRLTQLASQVQDMLFEGSIDMGHARALLSLSTDQQILLANKIVLRGLSVRETERNVQTMQQAGIAKLGASPTTGKSKPEKNQDLLRLETELADSLGADVKIESKNKQQGRLVISYASLDMLDGILEKLRGR